MALNGRLANADLAYIPGTGHRVRADLVQQTAALRAAFAHRFGRSLWLTDSYRDYNTQVRVFVDRYTRTRLAGRPSKVWNGVRYYQRPGTAMAAVPGTSNHGWGTAIDWSSNVNRMDSTEHRWMVANAPRFGWVWPEWWARRAGEAWHFEAKPVRVSSYAPYLVENRIAVPGTTLPDPLLPGGLTVADIDNILAELGTIKAAVARLDTDRAKGDARKAKEGVGRIEAGESPVTVRGLPIPDQVWGHTHPADPSTDMGGYVVSTYRRLLELTTTVAVLADALASAEAGQGGSLTAEQIRDAAEAGARTGAAEVLGNVEVTIDVRP